MILNNDKLLTLNKTRYFKLKRQKKQIDDSLKEVEEYLRNVMFSENIEVFHESQGRIHLIDKIIAVYPQDVKNEIDKVKERAEKDGKVTFRKTQYLRGSLKNE